MDKTLSEFVNESLKVPAKLDYGKITTISNIDKILEFTDLYHKGSFEVSVDNLIKLHSNLLIGHHTVDTYKDLKVDAVVGKTTIAFIETSKKSSTFSMVTILRSEFDTLIEYLSL